MGADVKLAMVLACSALLAACAQDQPQATGNSEPPATQTASGLGPYDGSWVVDAPAAGSGTSEVDIQRCEAVRLRFDVKNSQIVGTLGRSPYGHQRVSETAPNQTPMVGSVAPDGTFTSKWQEYTATGKLGPGDKAEMHWNGNCGPRTALGGREGGAPLAGSSRPPFSKSFGILFATNSAKLNDESRSVVKEAAAAAKDNAPAHITVGGHTDTVGSPSFNQKLSDRRAEAVRKELIANGVAAGDISTDGHGESDLAVPTADNVNEPKNRRVTIQVEQPGV
jgi:outer membrane protein OmpA-like peptidoglycan-associated protein